MANPIGSFIRRVLATLFVAFAGTILPGSSAHAADDCAATPAPTASPGSHWYYRTDSVKHTKCWFQAPEQRKPHRLAVEAEPATSLRQTPGEPEAASAQVERPSPPSKSDTARDEALAIFHHAVRESAQVSLQASSQAGSEANPEASSRPEAQKSDFSLQWPELRRSTGIDPGNVSRATAAFLIRLPAISAAPDDETQNEAQSTISADSAERSRTLARLILFVVGASAVACILQYAIFRLIARRRGYVRRARFSQSHRRGREKAAREFTAFGGS